MPRLPDHERRTRAYVEAVTSSSLPPAVRDAVLSHTAVLTSPTCFRIAGGTFLAWEGGNNDYVGPLIFLSTPENMTLPVGLVTLQAGHGGSPVVVFAAITAVVVPVLVLFLVFQRSFVASIAQAGASIAQAGLRG